MKKNMGHIDRIIRLAVAVLFAGLYFSGSIVGPLGLALVALSVVFVATSFMGSCPLYMPFGISTLRKKMAAKQ